VPWPRRPLARRGGSSGSSCGIHFFPRVDVLLVGLGSLVAQGVAIQSDAGVLLEAVPEVQQMHPVAAQLAGLLIGRHALGDAAEDQDDLGRPPLHPLEGPCR
jgi:hypothetical protein